MKILFFARRKGEHPLDRILVIFSAETTHRKFYQDRVPAFLKKYWRRRPVFIAFVGERPFQIAFLSAIFPEGRFDQGAVDPNAALAAIPGVRRRGIRGHGP